MTKFGKIFCNLVANFKGVQLSPLGFAACQSKNCTNNANRANYRRVWHPAIPTQTPNYLPTEVSGGEEPPTEATEPTEVSGARYSPTDCTDIHRLGGYGILPYSRSHQTIFPQKPTQPNHLCASEKSVGGSSPPEASVYSVKSVGEYPPPETSVNSVNSVGGLAQTNLEWVLRKEFGGRRGYGRDAIPSYENSHGLHGCAQIRRQNAT